MQGPCPLHCPAPARSELVPQLCRRPAAAGVLPAAPASSPLARCVGVGAVQGREAAPARLRAERRQPSGKRRHIPLPINSVESGRAGGRCAQVTSMIAAGPRQPATVGGSGDEPLKISIGSGMMGAFQ